MCLRVCVCVCVCVCVYVYVCVRVRVCVIAAAPAGFTPRDAHNAVGIRKLLAVRAANAEAANAEAAAAAARAKCEFMLSLPLGAYVLDPSDKILPLL